MHWHGRRRHGKCGARAARSRDARTAVGRHGRRQAAAARQGQGMLFFIYIARSICNLNMMIAIGTLALARMEFKVSNLK